MLRSSLMLIMLALPIFLFAQESEQSSRYENPECPCKARKDIDIEKFRCLKSFTQLYNCYYENNYESDKVVVPIKSYSYYYKPKGGLARTSVVGFDLISPMQKLDLKEGSQLIISDIVLQDGFKLKGSLKLEF